MKTFDDLRQGVASWRDSLADGWERLRRSAAGTLTRFRPGGKTDLPARHESDDDNSLAGMGWALLGGDVFEDQRRIVVRLEAPGLEKQDFDIQVMHDTLVVSGDKRFEREEGDGRWRLVQCAYGSFQRRFDLPAPVQADHAKATYRNGVLRIELRKLHPQAPAAVRTIPVH
ncbi:MAG: Hsp20/alpha crystallin family protein [Burkholderiaceae bacterium]|nr:Hsp20/alpha crystallin family protein [Burkholderiaceae bacterium]